MRAQMRMGWDGMGRDDGKVTRCTPAARRSDLAEDLDDEHEASP